MIPTYHTENSHTPCPPRSVLPPTCLAKPLQFHFFRNFQLPLSPSCSGWRFSLHPFRPAHLLIPVFFLILPL
jgi:hypothetical protein